MKLPGWKKEQKEKKRQKLVTKMRFLGVAIVLGLLVFAVFSFLKIYTTSVLPKNGRITIIYNTSPVKVLTFDQEGKIVFLLIPENIFLAGSLQEFLGAPIDGWLGAKTNLNIWDRFRIWWKISSAKTNLVQTIDLQEINPAKLDTELTGIFKDSGIVAEHLTIEVLNGSNKPEMANKAARLITNLGGTVITIGNSEKESEGCQIRARAEVLKSLTAKRLKEIFNCREIASPSLDSRADLQLIVGLAYWQKLNEK